MLRADEFEFQELIEIANANQDQWRFDDETARQFTIDIATIQRELSSLRLPTPVPSPRLRKAPSQTSQRSDTQEAIREKTIEY
jgi:hypothetical protein